MTDRLHRDRALPEGYQFGDAGKPPSFFERVATQDALVALPALAPWRPLHLNAAEQLARRGWNVIEGEDH